VDETRWRRPGPWPLRSISQRAGRSGWRRQAVETQQGPDEEGHCSGDGRTAAGIWPLLARGLGTRYMLYPWPVVPQPVGRVKRFSTFTVNSTARTHRCPERTDARSSGSLSADRPAGAVPAARPASLRSVPASLDSRPRKRPRSLNPLPRVPRRLPAPSHGVHAGASRPVRCQPRMPPSRSSGCPTSVRIYDGSRSRPD